MILTNGEYGSPVSVIPPAMVDDTGPCLKWKQQPVDEPSSNALFY